MFALASMYRVQGIHKPNTLYIVFRCHVLVGILNETPKFKGEKKLIMAKLECQ